MELTTFFTLIKSITPRMAFILFFGSLTILMLPTEALKVMTLENFVNKYRGGIWIVLLVSFLSMLYNFFPKVKNYINKNRILEKRKKRTSADLIKNLNNLSSKEKQYLRIYIYEDKTSHEFLTNDGTVHKLIKKGILYKSNRVLGNMLTNKIPFYINSFAKEYLDENPQLLN